MEDFWKALLKGLEDDSKTINVVFWITAFGMLSFLLLLLFEVP